MKDNRYNNIEETEFEEDYASENEEGYDSEYEEYDSEYNEEYDSEYEEEYEDEYEEEPPVKTKKRRRRNVISIILIVIAAAVFAFAAYKVITISKGYSDAEDVYRKTAEEVLPEPADENDPDSLGWNWDFSKLTDINPDVKGYLYMRGDLKNKVNYPVVQGYDNDYYLYRLINGESNRSGSLFIDYRIEDGMNARNCIIYGHNMNNEAMFGCLSDYENKAFFEKHKEFDVFIGYDHYIYKVFAAFQTDVEGFVYTYDFPTDDDFMNFIQKAVDTQQYDFGVDYDYFTPDSKIITLSTCTDVYDADLRFVVLLVRDRKVENNITR
ncbi:MAG: class B sortase [Parasporobacterium sp.]|nr:class B sortase [Parasporobacterium sp.]